MSAIIKLLKKCANTYTNLGEYYKANESEWLDVEEELGENLFETYPVEITDSIYDNLCELAQKLYPNDDFFNKVGASAERTLGKVQLPIPLGSMTESHLTELAEWLKPNTLYTLSHKLDGASCLLVYKNGQLDTAYTRGDGKFGQVITETIKRFGKDLPKTIEYNDEIMIRGEIIVRKSDEESLMKELKEETGKVYKNIRNTVSGCLNAKMAPNAFVKYAHFVGYFMDNRDLTNTEQSMFEWLNEKGFETPYYATLNSNDFNEEYLKNLNINTRENYIYEIDGTIITQDTMTDDVEGFETGTLNPKCSRKYKVGCVDVVKETKIVDVKWQVSSFGLFKPVIEVEPVEIDGATITFATGNNYKNVIDNHLCKGAVVTIKRAGLVIPFIEKTVSYPEIQDYNLPKCETTLSENEVDLIYNDEDTEYDSQIALQEMIYFCSSLGVEYAGEGNLKRLMEFLELKTMSVSNLISVPEKVFEDCIGVNGKKFYKSLHKKIENATVAEFMDAVSAFGRGIGQKKLQKIIDKYNDLPFEYEKIINVDGWSDITARQYRENYVVYAIWMEGLRNLGITLKSGVQETIEGDLNGLVVVFTGIRDKEMEQRITERGGKIASSFTKEVNLLIAKDVNSGSSKVQKALDKGIEVISYEDACEKY